MKLTIEIDESDLQTYEESVNERIELTKTMQERIPLYKNPKKLEKDVIYKEASYNFVIKGIEANDIKDKIFQVILDKWKDKKKCQ